MTFFELILLLNGYPIIRANALLKKINNLDKEEYHKWCEQQRNYIFQFHLENNLFYKKFIGIRPSRSINWEEIPILRKEDLRQPLDKLLSKGLHRRNVRISSTSGSSGTPFIFAKDKFSHSFTWALIKNRYKWHNVFLNSNQARFYGIPLQKKKYFFERFKDFLMNRYRFVVFDLSDYKLEEFANKFRTRRFRYVYGYTNSIVVFSKYLIRHNINVKRELCPTLECCIVTSEQCSLSDKSIIEKALGVPVYNEYGASELDLIAFSNKENKWIVSSESVYIEIVDDNGKNLKNGAVGRIILTSLHNKAMPFIRYEIGDLGSIEECSVTKQTYLSTLNGRLNDMIYLPSGKIVPGFTLYYVIRQILENCGIINEYLIKQVKLNSFIVEIVSKQPISVTHSEIIISTMEQYLEPNLSIDVVNVDSIVRTKSGKFKHFISHL